MLLTEFEKKIVNEYPYNFTTADRVRQFKENCEEELKKYEGKVLSATWTKILKTHRNASHPKMAVILEIVNSVLTSTYKTQNPHNQERIDLLNIAKIKDEFKATKLFKQCCKAMIGHDVLVFIEHNGKVPETADLTILKNAHKETKDKFEELHNKTEFSGWDSTIYKVSRDLIQSNQDYFNKFNEV
jgi:hypothetical protein